MSTAKPPNVVVADVQPRLRRLVQTLTFKGIAVAVFAGAAFPYISQPIENILVDIFPKNRVLIVNGLAILGAGLSVGGGAAALKGRIEAGGVSTPKHFYGPDDESPAEIAESQEPLSGE